MRRPAWAGVLVIVLAVGLAGAADPPAGDVLDQTIRENTAELEALRRRIAEHRERLEGIEGRATAVRRSFAEIEQEQEAASRQLSEMARREHELLAQSGEMAAQIEVSSEEFTNRREALGRRLRAMYVRGGTDDLRAILNAGSVSEVLARVRVTRALARLEARLMERTREQGRQLVRRRRLLDSALAEIWQARASADDQTARMEMLQAEKTSALRALDEERQGLRDELLTLDLNQQKLTYLLEDLEQQRAERGALPDTGTVRGPSLAERAGTLAWPVEGPLLRGFGRSVHPRFQTVTLNNGLNIGAPAGSPVAAVAEGVVEYGDDLPGFGRCVIVDHGEGYYTLYAHLDRVFVSVGEDVAGGQVIAEVAVAAADEPAQLYFELRHGRTPLDPADWLRSR